MYRYTESGEILRESDGACIPCDPMNRDYRRVLESGAEIAPYVPCVSPFEGMAQAEHDEWIIQQAVSRIKFPVAAPEPDFNAIIQRDERAGAEEELAAAKARIAELENEPMREIDIRGVTYKFTAIDALTLMGAFIVNLARDPAEVRLASGERVTVTIDDVEHIGRQLAGKEP